MHDGDMVTPDMLPPLIKRLNGTHAAPAPAASASHPLGAANGSGAGDKIRPLWQVEREAIESAIAACEGNVPRAAVRLEISPSTIYRKLQAWEEKR